MTNKSIAATVTIVALVTSGSVGCSNSHAPTPAAPSVVSQPTPRLVTFTDPLTGSSTSDVRDAQDHVVQFTTANELIWTDGTHLPGHEVSGPGHAVAGNLPAEASCECWLVVRFGTAGGERHAYMTGDVGHSNPGTVVDLELAGSTLVVSWSDAFPPGTHTLFGVITEATVAGLAPIENAEVWRVNEEQGGWDHSTTDKNGFYQLPGLSDGSRETYFKKEGYQDVHQAAVQVRGDTEVDVQMLRR